jgi:dihydropteroate synthase
MNQIQDNIRKIDDELSKRDIKLDPAGYFIIYLDREAGLICAKHFTNIINERGLAVDPATGKVIPAKGKVDRVAETVYSAKTAKELCVKIIEEPETVHLSFLDHAAYLGREFVRAEYALISGEEYIQD